jgi:hypothetical protein
MSERASFLCTRCKRDERQIEPWQRFIETATGLGMCLECCCAPTPQTDDEKQNKTEPGGIR